MGNFTVNQKKKVVTVYSQSIDDLEYKQVRRYKDLGYDIIMLEKKKRNRVNKNVKNDMIKYLKGNINNSLYNELIDRIDKKQKFLIVKWWLTKALQEIAEKENKPFETIEEIINKAKSREERALQNENEINIKVSKSNSKEIKDSNN